MARKEMNQDQIDKHDLVLQSQELANIMLQAKCHPIGQIAADYHARDQQESSPIHDHGEQPDSSETPPDWQKLGPNRCGNA